MSNVKNEVKGGAGRDIIQSEGSMIINNDLHSPPQNKAETMGASKVSQRKIGTKSDIFISHVSEEKAIAGVLKDWISTTFLGGQNIFVSSDKGTMNIGDEWLGKIETSIRSSRIAVALLSPTSLSAPWINFEVGGAWMTGIRVMCVCHSGLKRDGLPPPYSHRMAIELEDPSFSEKFIRDIAGEYEITSLPRIDYKIMQSELIAAVMSVQNIS